MIKKYFSSKKSYTCFAFYILLTTYYLLFPINANADQPKQICLRDACLAVEIADTDIKRTQGLQGRTSMKQNHGMLFIFPYQNVYNFWMKDTLIPLDMIWIDNAFQVVDLKENVPPCVKDPCEVYVPKGEAQYVLEVNAHFAQKHGIKSGDSVVFK